MMMEMRGKRRLMLLLLDVLVVLSCMMSCSPILSDHVTSRAQAANLTSRYYDASCPTLQWVVRAGMKAAVSKEPRMAASILRLFFHDCFVQGCDASILLDDTSTFQGEKTAFPNVNSVRGFDVIDTIKSSVEAVCPGIVSCADILALSARDAVVLTGGQTWRVLFGRRDSTSASYSEANVNLPGPNEDVESLISKFEAQGLSIQDLVTLSGAHTIGQARCVTFRSRLYDHNGTGQPDATLDTTYLKTLQALCPTNGSDDTLTPLDVKTENRFDTCYYSNLVSNKGLLNSDQELYSSSENTTSTIIQSYIHNPRSFFTNFSISMIAMGNIKPLTGNDGQIRKNCRVVN